MDINDEITNKGQNNKKNKNENSINDPIQ